eukprot:3270585-Rhodomonas_salina.3
MREVEGEGSTIALERVCETRMCRTCRPGTRSIDSSYLPHEPKKLSSGTATTLVQYGALLVNP